MNKITLLIIFALMLASCKLNITRRNNELDKNEANKVIANYYAALKENRLNDAMTFIHPYLYLNTDTIKFRENLKNIATETHNLKSHNLDHWESRVIDGIDGQSVYYMFFIDSYANYATKVSMQLIKNEHDSIKIFALEINPNEFAKWQMPE